MLDFQTDAARGGVRPDLGFVGKVKNFIVGKQTQAGILKKRPVFF